MSAPQHQSTKGPRRSGRKPRPTDSSQDGPLSSATIQPHNTPPIAVNQTKSNPKGQPRRSSHAHIKNHNDGNTSDRARHTNIHPEKARATPVKQQPAYAGSTFQQSPAASALPIPSFYSKSLPTASFVPPHPAKEATPPLPTSITPPHESPSNRESTPCDFLFEAARKAKATPRGGSPAATSASGNLSVPTGSPAPRSPGPREGDALFPFELDGAAIPGEDGSSFAAPYRDRMAALRSTRSQGAKSMDENERKAKTEALKKLLMKSSGQDGSTLPHFQPDPNNPFDARPLLQQGAAMIRPSSNPSTPVYMQDSKDQQPSQTFHHIPYHYTTGPLQTPKRPTSSGLRNVYGAQSEPEYAELSSDNAVTPPTSTARKQPLQPAQQYGGFAGRPYAPQPQVPAHRAKPSAQQLEDDLRRVLKLDLTSRG